MIKDEFYTSVNRHRNLIRYRGYTGEGKRIQSYHDFKPTFFLPVKELTAIKTLKGENLKKYNPGTMRECDQFVRKYKAHVGPSWGALRTALIRKWRRTSYFGLGRRP